MEYLIGINLFLALALIVILGLRDCYKYSAANAFACELSA